MSTDFCLGIARRPAGFGRYETLGTVFLGVILLAAAAGITWEASSRFGQSVVPAGKAP